MVTEAPKGPLMPGGRRPGPLLSRILQRERTFTAGMSVVLGLPSEGTQEAPAPVEAPAQPSAPEVEEPSGLNRGALLSRLQGTHQANLHRGFYALLNSAVPTAQVVADPDGLDAGAYRVRFLDLDSITPNPYLPPAPDDEEAMELLTQSIREQGILEPLQVHPAPQDTPGGAVTYWVISGERRREAARRAGLSQVPTIIKDVAPRAALQIFLSQALHTHQLSLLDYAQVIRVLTQEMGMTPSQIASRIGAAAADIEAELQLLGLEEEIQQSLRDGRLSAGQAKVLLEAPDRESREALWEYALRYGPAPARMRERLQQMMEGEPLAGV